MADVTLKYKGATIGELSETGNKTIETAGKYCEADILLEYVKSGVLLPYFLSYDVIDIDENITKQIKNFAADYIPFDSENVMVSTICILMNTSLNNGALVSLSRMAPLNDGDNSSSNAVATTRGQAIANATASSVNAIIGAGSKIYRYKFGVMNT